MDGRICRSIFGHRRVCRLFCHFPGRLFCQSHGCTKTSFHQIFCQMSLCLGKDVCRSLRIIIILVYIRSPPRSPPPPDPRSGLSFAVSTRIVLPSSSWLLSSATDFCASSRTSKVTNPKPNRGREKEQLGSDQT